MKDFWKKYKIKIVILAYLVAVPTILHFVVVPFVDKIRAKSDSIQEEIISNRISESRIEKIPDMEKALENCRNNSKALDVIISSEDEVAFIKQLESIADATGNKIILNVGEDNIKQNGKNAASNNKEKTIKDGLQHKSYMPMDINLKGNYSGLVNFINRLENTGYYVNILSISSKETIEEISFQPDEASSKDVFSTPSSSENMDSKPGLAGEKRELLDSMIRIIVYTEK